MESSLKFTLWNMNRSTLSYPNVIIRLLSVLMVAFLLSSCANQTGRSDDPPEVLLAKGKRFIKKKKWEKAQDAFLQTLEDHPDSPERIPALLLLSDSYYADEQYEEAKFNYQKFTELYPANRKVEHAHFYKAMSDFKQIDIASRDQTFTTNSLELFQKLLEDFPNGRYKGAIEKKIAECEKKIAENMFFIGKFYFRTHSYQSAIKRFDSLLAQYPDQKFNDEAMYLLAESYFLEENYSKAGEFFKKFLKRYPRSEFAKEARLRLRKFR